MNRLRQWFPTGGVRPPRGRGSVSRWQCRYFQNIFCEIAISVEFSWNQVVRKIRGRNSFFVKTGAQVQKGWKLLGYISRTYRMFHPKLNKDL